MWFFFFNFLGIFQFYLSTLNSVCGTELSNMQILQEEHCNTTQKLVVFLYAFIYTKLE